MSSYEQTSLQGSIVVKLRAQAWEVDCLSSKPVLSMGKSLTMSTSVFICLLSTSSCPSDLDPVLHLSRAHVKGAVGELD